MQSQTARPKSRMPLFLTSLAAAVAAHAAQPPPASLPDVRAVVRQRGKAVVKIETLEYYLPGLLRRTGRLLNPFPLRSTIKDAASLALFVPSAVIYPLRRHIGSGVLIDTQGHLLTNHHVVRGADKITVHLTDAKGVRRRFKAKALGRDPQTDIALVKIDPRKTPVVTAPLGDADALEPGDWIIAIGHPLNLTGSVTVGVVSGRHRQLRANPLEDYIQIEAAVNPGNSGGPVLNTRGEVVGIVALGIFPANDIGFAVSTSLIAPFLDDFKTRRRPRRGYLGVTLRDITPHLASTKKLDTETGILVEDVKHFSPAGRAGLKRGDILVSVAGRKVAKARDAQMLILRTRPGTAIPLAVRRKGKLLTLEPTLRQRRAPFRIF